MKIINPRLIKRGVWKGDYFVDIEFNNGYVEKAIVITEETMKSESGVGLEAKK
jgi:hypothetical protein